MVGVAVHLRRKIQSPWCSAIEKGIDSLADWLILTLGRPDDFTFLLHCHYSLVYSAPDEYYLSPIYG